MVTTIAAKTAVSHRMPTPTITTTGIEAMMHPITPVMSAIDTVNQIIAVVTMIRVMAEKRGVPPVVAEVSKPITCAEVVAWIDVARLGVESRPITSAEVEVWIDVAGLGVITSSIWNQETAGNGNDGAD